MVGILHIQSAGYHLTQLMESKLKPFFHSPSHPASLGSSFLNRSGSGVFAALFVSRILQVNPCLSCKQWS
jgi:hypothetical protein